MYVGMIAITLKPSCPTTNGLRRLYTLKALLLFSIWSTLTSSLEPVSLLGILLEFVSISLTYRIYFYLINILEIEYDLDQAY